MITRPILVGGLFATTSFVTLLDATLKSSLLLLAAFFLLWILRRSSAALRHALLAGVLCITIILPAVSWCVPRWSLLPGWLSLRGMPVVLFTKDVSVESPPVRPETTEPGSGLAFQPLGISDRKPSASATKVVTVDPPRLKAALLLRIWCIGSGAMMLGLMAGAYRLRRRKSRSRLIHAGPLLAMLRSCKQELGHAGKVQLRIDERSAMPSCWGIFYPTIMLPGEAESWQRERMRHVLLHELAHVKRRDPLFLTIAFTALSLQWFNPLLWFGWRVIRKEQERACDDLVLNQGVKSSDYAEDVLEIAHSFPCGGTLPMQLNMARGSGLETRIGEILDASRQRKGPSRRVLLAMAACFPVLCLILGSLAAAPGKAIARGPIKDRNGVILVETNDGMRTNPYGALASHLLGATNNGTGSFGIEKMLDDDLAAGKGINLTIDARMQAMCETILRSSGVGRGAVVIMDPNNGDILSMASVPNFDPQRFHEGMKADEFKVLSSAATAPMLNRAMATVPPGSTFKLLSALAACEQGGFQQRHVCDGFVQYGNHRLGCWIWNASQGKHGELDLSSAIHGSCSIYFYELGNAIGAEGFRKTIRSLGWDEPSIGLAGERLPSLIERKPDAASTPLEIAMLSVGQGVSSASPVHLAQLTSVIANGGKVFLPRLDADGPIRMKADLIEQGVDPQGLAMIREGMRRAVQEKGGTAAPVNSGEISISAKTGTAQTVERGQRSTNAWCTAFAPSEQPRFVVTVLVVGGGSGGRVAGPLVRSILENLDALPALKPQPVYAGNLERLEEVDAASIRLTD